MTEPWLPFDEEGDAEASRIDERDRAGRARAVDPRFNVALEASAGTGKTRVLVDRYVNLLRAGVDPSEILALTFTRKAAAEMRDRILATLQLAAARGELTPARWRALRDRTGDVAISTIDAFCLSLLREFPLEADLDPGFQVADETEVPRLVDEALDRALRVCRAVARDDEHVALVFAQLGDRRARRGLASLLARRLSAPAVLARAAAPRDLTVHEAVQRAARALVDVFDLMRGGLDRFLETGPLHPAFRVFARRLEDLGRSVAAGEALDPAAVQVVFGGAREHFLTRAGQPRTRLPGAYPKAAFATPDDWRAHRDLVVGHARALLGASHGYRRDLNALVSRGVWRMFRIAEAEYRRTLDMRALLDFPDILLKALELLRQMEEFAQSRFRLESRYHHVLVDEFQDTSRPQWELISLLVQAWGEGAGLAHTGPLPPSIFIVGDRKQSIYGFRDADVSLFHEASRYLESLRAGGDVRRSISRSFRSVAPLLAFVNDLFEAVDKAPDRPDAFSYDEHDRFPIDTAEPARGSSPLSLVIGSTLAGSAGAVAAEVARLLAAGTVVRDRDTGLRRPVRAGDVAILFRARDSHREYERALDALGIPAYVYRGLGFFEADEVQDVLAALRHLADPVNDLRAAAWLRSRFIRMSDEGLRRLAPRLAHALDAAAPPAVVLDDDDAEALALARAASVRWRAWADRLPPAELLDRLLAESAYAVELRGRRRRQAVENLKKIRAIVRRIQNRGYATLDRIVTHLDRLALGDEANAVIDATDSVGLMTVHASKGLEFPVVFVVDLGRGTGSRRDAIRVAGAGVGGDGSVAVGDFESPADEDRVHRDREETKRLLYVALTRARDRLYLGATLDTGAFRPAPGSLGEVLPADLQQIVAESGSSPTVEWPRAGGHVFTVCRAVEVAASPRTEAVEEVVAGAPDDLEPLADPERPAVAVTALIGGDEDAVRSGGGEAARLVGLAVHRLLQRVKPGSGEPDDRARARVVETVRSAFAGHDGLESLVETVLMRFRGIASDPRLVEWYQHGHAMHEVPFTVFADGRAVRGVIDCLLVLADRLVVLEFKTGTPRPSDRAQAALYRSAVEALFPGRRVEHEVVYASRSGAAADRS